MYPLPQAKQVIRLRRFYSISAWVCLSLPTHFSAAASNALSCSATSRPYAVSPVVIVYHHRHCPAHHHQCPTLLLLTANDLIVVYSLLLFYHPSLSLSIIIAIVLHVIKVNRRCGVVSCCMAWMIWLLCIHCWPPDTMCHVQLVVVWPLILPSPTIVVYYLSWYHHHHRP